uniref:Uncharacterized protein n=1 Tax=Plectus sambesii TaxID=2011161 RepID=A0A914WTY2_9BILA
MKAEAGESRHRILSTARSAASARRLGARVPCDFREQMPTFRTPRRAFLIHALHAIYLRPEVHNLALVMRTGRLEDAVWSATDQDVAYVRNERFDDTDVCGRSARFELADTEGHSFVRNDSVASSSIELHRESV